MASQKARHSFTAVADATLVQYTESFYHYLSIELDEGNKSDLAPLIAQAYEQRIDTMALVEIVKSSIS